MLITHLSFMTGSKLLDRAIILTLFAALIGVALVIFAVSPARHRIKIANGMMIVGVLIASCFALVPLGRVDTESSEIWIVLGLGVIGVSTALIGATLRQVIRRNA
ncbi:MAG: hypothetical protein AAF797_11585 [Planctomycetota bacterium]